MQHSPVLEHLRAPLHPGDLQHIQPPPDASLFPPNLRPEQLHALHPAGAVFHPQYALNAPPPQADALNFGQHHGLPTVPTQYGYSNAYQHASSPRFAVANTPLPGPVPHFHGPQAQPNQQQPLPAPTPIRAAPQVLSRRYEHVSQVVHPVLPPADDGSVAAGHGQFQGLKLVPDPPDLYAWREKLFHVDDMITLTEDEFQTYFPHVDNVYSHRSTQRHKRKRFVSHYWDCRLKGRPPGTKKSTDPDKKKRKRVARERDLCDVKIKITEYFDQQEYEEQLGQRPPGAENLTSKQTGTVGSTNNTETAQSQSQQFFDQPNIVSHRASSSWDISSNVGQHGVAMPQFASSPDPPPPLGTSQKKFYTVQRVNGNGGNGKGDGVAGPHKHSLEQSDRVKKNSVLRWLAKREKDDRKKPQGGDPTKKTYHKKATGNAWTTVKNHSKDNDLKLYGSAFCPFVQRVWISLEHKQIPYQYVEVDPYRKPQSLLDVNPRGLVPAIRHGPSWSVHESTVIMEYLEDLNVGSGLLPSNAQTRATTRLWTDHINRNIIPWFYKLLQAQEQNDQVAHAKEFRDQIGKLVDAADPNGPFFLGPEISFVDVQIAPWIVRLRRVLGPYRGWPEAEEGSRWRRWIDAIESNESVKMTTSTDELYLDSYERYAENRPGTSQVADAINSGRGLP